jgi:nitroreductase
MSDTYDVVVGLRAVRHFEPGPLPAETVDAILHAARWTGSSKNLQKWSFVVLEGREVREQLASAGNFTDPVRNASLAVALVWPEDGYEFDIGRVAQSMMLAAASVGVASCPVTLHDEDRAREVLGVPGDHRCRYAIAFGIPDLEAEEADRARRRAAGWGGRKPPSQLFHRDRYRPEG